MASPTATDARRAVLGRVIDHAALFPPASLTMDAALAEDRRARATAEAWMLDRFICPASRLDELRAALGGEPAPGLSVVLDGAGGAPPADWPAAVDADLAVIVQCARSGLPVELLEVRLPEPAPDPGVVREARRRAGAALGERVAPFFEVPLGPDWRTTVPAAVAAVAAAGAGAKLRCGGVVREAFPSVGQVACFVAACRDAGVRFKATAGLHHPVRHTEAATGFPMHGFLNLLAAAVLAQAGAPEPELAAVLAEEDPGAFAAGPDGFLAGGHRADAGEIEAARGALFVAYGSCSFAEPVEDLRALGILPR